MKAWFLQLYKHCFYLIFEYDRSPESLYYKEPNNSGFHFMNLLFHGFTLYYCLWISHYFIVKMLSWVAISQLLVTLEKNCFDAVW